MTDSPFQTGKDSFCTGLSWLQVPGGPLPHTQGRLCIVTVLIAIGAESHLAEIDV